MNLGLLTFLTKIREKNSFFTCEYPLSREAPILLFSGNERLRVFYARSQAGLTVVSGTEFNFFSRVFVGELTQLKHELRE